ncbi:Lsr2 family protein [Corynebacterium sp. HS2168-gen11]|uniref:histone-like nucleoid-structuring protein Lsr2 n=1 Tax=Corynebacterium sp. HS2168-gen11 TaxID=2974027 RepID=UPI00216B0CB9|nr:Lsr2 family protein [Corynebacterium sp. HS2168-gen11]MCS4536488.1 Lsr2 family protein [Corynebacterium sp. HS2168-gen11]
MARREIVQIFDDLDNQPLDENDVHVLHFSVDGSNYVMDVSGANRDKFRAAIAEFIAHARKDTTIRRDQSYNPRDVREWALARGYDVAVRGKLSQKIIESYLAANA